MALTLATALGLSQEEWSPYVLAGDPFETSPAENFPIGADGIVPPPARPVPGMTRAQVADALEQVKRALVASYLHPRLLFDHDPSVVLGLLAEDSADVIRGRFGSGDYGTALVRLAPGTALADEPRVTGEMTYRRVDWRGLPALEVVSNYVVAYAFARPEGLVVIHAETRWAFPLAGDLLPSSTGMYLAQTKGYWHGMDCVASARGLTAPAPEQDRAADPEYQATDPLDAYFDPTRPVTVESRCS